VPYSATVYRLLISSPGDVTEEDIASVMRAVARWNVVYGRAFGSVVVPLHWDLHAAAEHGVRPQASINAQLVEDADIVLALFRARLGSPTGEAESGTVEEINKARKDGAYVAILRCLRDVDPRNVDPEQLQRLNDFFDRVRSESLILTYANDAELRERVDAVLNQAITQTATRAEAVTEMPPARATVWPRVESSRVPSGSRMGGYRTDWRLVLANTGEEAAHDVRFRLEPEKPDDQPPQVMDGDAALESLAPGSDAKYALALFMGAAPQARCVVSWTDTAGEHENVATLRFF
jgi:hypothetical protein